MVAHRAFDFQKCFHKFYKAVIVNLIMPNKKGLSGVGISFIVVGALILLFVLGIVFFAIGTYNKFVTLDQSISGQWSEVESQYQRQADLIPNLVSIVASAAKVETKYVTDVTEARTKWLNAKTESEKDVAGVQMNGQISALVNAISTAENYPVLQANKQYSSLMDETSGTQNRITVARGRYIENLKSYNIAVKRFPANIFAGMFGFKEKEYYKAAEGSLQTPKLGEGKLP
jgi:LemA protein